MIIGVPTEVKEDEYRVAVTPAGVIATRYSSAFISLGTPMIMPTPRCCSSRA